MPSRVVILTARMGAGHDGVASELARSLAARGVDAELIDVWDLLPVGVGRLITAMYKVMICRYPWLYEGIYRVWLRPGGESRRRASPLVRLAAARLQRKFEGGSPQVVVSVFHLCSQVVGDMRRRGALDAVTITLVVDFAAHGLWVDPDVDIHLALHPVQARRIEAQGAPRVEVITPVVNPAYRDCRENRAAARARLGVPDRRYVALVVAGSWGAGRIDATVAALRRAGGFRVVVVTGRNERLYRQLVASGCSDVHRWVDDMAPFLVGADVVIENAGGLTAMEAMAVGTPVVSFNPIPGHGRENVATMAEAGISAMPRTEDDLIEVLRDLAGEGLLRQRMTRTARAMFAADAEAADLVADLARRARVA